jgi:uncharacterized protein YPO0396
MSDLLEFFEDDSRAGFRLHRAEVYNWGTFHGKVWTLWARGRNTLLTGDIGSGKSTFVDAITTLLVPSQKIVYNKAAGAETRERTLRSYLMGSYKAERGEESGSSRAVGLRDARSYSVILAHFRNEGYNADVTLAQVFWFKDPQQPPARFHVVADRAMGIAEDFSGFGADINNLKKRLRATEKLEVFDAFKDYQDAYRRRFGIENPQALELFHQTVSMKAIGNLTDFVRDHMLEAFDSRDRVEHLLTHFDDLTRAHGAVLRAKDQIERLTPLVEDCDRLAETQAEAAGLRQEREALRPWFAGLKAELLVKRLGNLAQDTRRHAQKRAGIDEVRGRALVVRDDLVRAIAENGGDRLLRLESDLAGLRTETEKRRSRTARYSDAAAQVGLPAAEDPEAFAAQRSALAALRDQLRGDQADVQNQRSEADAAFRELRKEHRVLTDEIESIRHRPSNIPREQVLLRARLAAEFGADAEQLPFAGELLAVRDEFAPWEGAIERVLRSFALSLLVADELYPRVSAWIDQNALGTRLVYFRVRPVEGRRAETQPDSLVDRVVVKTDGAHRDWLRAELARRFDYVCCDTLERFRRERQALTRAGQVKGGERHEKDDRHRLDDRTRYVLGWTNRAKLDALEAQEKAMRARLADAGGQLAGLQARESELGAQLEGVAALEGFTDFTDLDWRATVRQTAVLEGERDELRRSSSVLDTLRSQLAEADKSLAETSRALNELAQEEGQAKEKTAVAQAALEEARAVEATGTGLEESYTRLAAGQAAALGSTALTVESCESRQSDYRQLVQNRIDAEEKKVARLREKIVQAMKDFQAAFPVEARELDASPEAARGYRDRLGVLVGDDLPRFEKEFKKLLNENTIREVAQFQASLNRDRQTIVERMDRINLSLAQIDYNRGRYIRLDADAAADTEIRDFYRELRACTESSLSGSGDDQYAEAKFLQVRAILERFRHRPGLEELDRKWTEKVTDVRQAFVFSASERWREDDREHEHYTDSAGKSGGQKEKLAYTVLAASLAYQFGLEWGEVHSRTFRFVAIDEAFGRGSDESTRYGLSLFAKLNLQLLLITPLQKIPVIEPFVASVGFVSNEEGRDSRLRNLTIEEYRTERQVRATP